MSDLISRETVLNIWCANCIITKFGKACNRTCRDIERIKAVPAVDAVPVVHGWWIEVDGNDFEDDHWQCSACGHEIYNDFALMEEVQEMGGALFCEHCGTKMDGDKDD